MKAGRRMLADVVAQRLVALDGLSRVGPGPRPRRRRGLCRPALVQRACPRNRAEPRGCNAHRGAVARVASPVAMPRRLVVIGPLVPFHSSKRSWLPLGDTARSSLRMTLAARVGAGGVTSGPAKPAGARRPRPAG